MVDYLFDVDGTLTPSRQRIDDEFAKFFLQFCETHNVYLITGSDRQKTLEQLGEEIYNSCKTVYNCSGNDVWQGNVNIYTSDWKLPTEVEHKLEELLEQSEYPIRTGNHIEHRTGLVNFSIVGRNANHLMRSHYHQYDLETNERIHIAEKLNELYPELSVIVGGETGLDISEKDKSQIASDFTDVVFFGDRMDPNGNDYTLSQAIPNSYHVKDYHETWRILSEQESI